GPPGCDGGGRGRRHRCPYDVPAHRALEVPSCLPRHPGHDLDHDRGRVRRPRRPTVQPGGDAGAGAGRESCPDGSLTTARTHAAAASTEATRWAPTGWGGRCTITT